jgi:Mg2+ and Co2+ transporter CorA
MQKDVLLSWREQARYEFTASHTIKYNDLDEHLSRVSRLSDGLRADLDSLTQIYFASTSQQTNSNVQLLAVISAIFLPLNLIAGIFGMNFESIPLLTNPLGPYMIISIMLSISALLLWWFKKKRWY